ncbi:MAG: PQQ-binding-like beta-propeller repeat protein [Deltaproteobacteria bacterium]|nr:PQQ-binding-like beta-propeller repeat protein [Deltaproteobacteria bacterium]
MITALLACVLAASAVDPAWTMRLGEGGALPFLSDAGVVLVWLPQEVLGLDPEDGELLWRRPQRTVARGDLFHRVPHTPYVLFSSHAPGPDTFELVDARTGETAWTAPPGQVVLGVYPSGRGAAAEGALVGHSVLVVSDLVEDPGHFGLARVDLPVGTVAWAKPDAMRAPMRAPPVVLRTHPGRRSQALTTRGNPGPRFHEEGVLSYWSPRDGLVRRGWADGEVRWRLVLPGLEPRLPVDGFADLVVEGDMLLLPADARRLTMVDARVGSPLWRPGRGRTRGPVNHVRVSEETVVVAGEAWVDAFRLRNGGRAWKSRVQTSAPVVEVAVGLGGAFVLDDQGVVTGLSVADGAIRFVRSVRDSDLEPVGDLVVRADSLVHRMDCGVVALDPASGEVLWRVSGPPVLGRFGADLMRIPLGGLRPPWDDHDLYRETPPGDSERFHYWSSRERGPEGRLVEVLHRTDLDTGSDTSVPLGSEQPQWLLDFRTGTALVFEYGGEVTAWRFAEQ